MRRRIILTIGQESSQSPLRLGIELRVLIAVVLVLLGGPILFVMGTTWGAQTLLTDLLRQNATLQMENASYREATTELVAQVATLQAAADDLGARATVDPQAARAMDRLPSSITNRAMGGGSSVADVAGPLTTVASSADPAFGLLRDVLHIVDRQLDHARAGVERREALAAATPSIWPVTGWLTSTFGSRSDPFNGRPDFHSGLDISADAGQRVRATADGTVVTARPTGNFGNLVVIDHGFGIGTRYGHLSRFAVSEGQHIRKGDTVGYVGSTGRSTNPHLHYELLLNGRRANPLRLLGR
ncbi:MAG: M23 family metallopeptidase [Vicinamibacterales bacterium]